MTQRLRGHARHLGPPRLLSLCLHAPPAPADETHAPRRRSRPGRSEWAFAMSSKASLVVPRRILRLPSMITRGLELAAKTDSAIVRTNASLLGKLSVQITCGAIDLGRDGRYSQAVKSRAAIHSRELAALDF